MTAHVRAVARMGAWPAAVAFVVLVTHVLAYALAPAPALVGGRLEYGSGGSPSYLPGIVALTLAVVCSCVVVRVAAVAVAERVRLEPLAPAITRLSCCRVAARAVGLSCAGLLGFAAFESFVHWRAGLGWHGLECLAGPVHRNAMPIVVAVSVLVAALVAATGHALEWVRRLVGALRRDRVRMPVASGPGRLPLSVVRCRSLVCNGALGPRAPPRWVSRITRPRPAPS